MIGIDLIGNPRESICSE